MDVWECALGFMDAQVLLTAEELGVFDSLADGKHDAEAIAEAVNLPLDSTRRLLTALCALGLVERQADGTYQNGPDADRQLVRGRPGYIGGLFKHVREDLYPLWGHFRSALEENRAQWDRVFGQAAPGNDRLYEDEAALRSFMDGMHAISYRSAREFAAQAHELNDVRHLVDIGGASGAFVIGLVEAFPDLHGTVLDLPPVRPITEDYFQKHKLNGQARFMAGNFWDDPLPAGADAYSLGFILHDWDDEGGSFLLSKIAEAAAPGALLIIGEFLFNENRTGPLFVARQDLNMMVAARGRERTAADYGDWIGSYGFNLERIVHTSHGKNFLIARR